WRSLASCRRFCASAARPAGPDGPEAQARAFRSTALSFFGSGRRGRIRALGRRFVARRTEFAVGAPVRPFARIGEPLADEMQQIPVLRHAAEVPCATRFTF